MASKRPSDGDDNKRPGKKRLSAKFDVSTVRYVRNCNVTP